MSAFTVSHVRRIIMPSYLSSFKVLNLELPLACIGIPRRTAKLMAELGEAVNAQFPGCTLEVPQDLGPGAVVLGPLGVAFKGVLIGRAGNITPDTRVSVESQLIVLPTEVTLPQTDSPTKSRRDLRSYRRLSAAGLESFERIECPPESQRDQLR
jgi:hypothetical protein